VIALGVLAASVGLIRSETARDLRTLTAAGASSTTRRMITAATAAALGLLGAILGMAGAVIAGLVWAHSSLSAMFGDVPLTDVLILLAGPPRPAAGYAPGVSRQRSPGSRLSKPCPQDTSLAYAGREGAAPPLAIR
jgi:putative ABC transport system permease protein